MAEDAATDAAPPIEFTARESGLLVGPLIEEGSLAAAALWADERQDLFLQRLSDRGTDLRVVRRVETISPDRWSIRVEAAAGEQGIEPAWNELVRAADGEITLPRNDANKIASSFAPPALFMPAVLSAGDETERAFTVQSEGPPFGKGSGEGRSLVRGVGRQLIRTPAGDSDAFVFEWGLTFSVGPAVISLFRRGWIDDTPGGAGVVAEEARETVKVFGIGFRDVTRVSVLERTGVGESDAVGE